MIDVWSLNQKSSRFSIEPKNVPQVKRLLKDLRLSKEIVFRNLQNVLDKQDQVQSSNQSPLIPMVSPFFQKYQKMGAIQDYFDSLIDQYPHLAESFTIG